MTQPTPDLTNSYRYTVRHIGSRIRPGTYDRSQNVKEYGAEVVDTWTGDVMTVHWAASAELSSLVAETQCAERNAPATSITFPSKLALFIDRARDAETNPGDILKDVSRILEWHLGRVRGLTHEPLSQPHMYVQAPEFNS